MMHQAFDVHSLRHARFAKQIDGTAFQNSRADAPQHILRRLTLKNDRVDAGVVQELPQQQPGRASANNRDLCFDRIVSLLQG